jgi:putative restriction endonuclease
MRNIYCAVTDTEWYQFLCSQSDLPEINFWKPTPQNFKAVGEGDIFAFKLKSPYNKIAGFGILTTSANAQIKMAWDAFGVGNGVKNLDVLIEKIRSIRKPLSIDEYSLIGVRVLVHQVFFPENLWIDPPSDWAGNIVTGKTYSTETMTGLKLFHELEERARDFQKPSTKEHHFSNCLIVDPKPTGYGDPIPVRPRIGQGTFRINVIRAYDNECALSGTRVTPALEAVHIKPFSVSQDHSIQNGILLRRDIHSVFDAGFATFDESCCFVVSPKVKEIFNNGHEYRKLHGKHLRMPLKSEWNPSSEYLEWHRNERYVGD